MKLKFAIGLMVIALVAPIAIAEESEWVDLFNGKDLDNWVQRNGVAKYHIDGDTIVGTSVPNTGNSFLCTKDTYKNFILEFEFMGHPDLNSGVQVRSETRGKNPDGRVNGYQVELEQESRDRWWSGGIYDEARRGWIYPHKDDEEAGKKFGEQGEKCWKVGEWNTIRVEAKGDHIDTWVNGEHRAKLVDDMTPEGFIALQVHGVGDKEEPMTVKWRNIRIQVLED